MADHIVPSAQSFWHVLDPVFSWAAGIGGALATVATLITAGMFVKGVHGKAEEALDMARDALNKAESARADLAAFREEAAKTFAPNEAVHALSERVDRGFSEVRSDVRADNKETRDLIIAALTGKQ